MRLLKAIDFFCEAKGFSLGSNIYTYVVLEHFSGRSGIVLLLYLDCYIFSCILHYHLLNVLQHAIYLSQQI